jgi:regulator of RNase E activity RraA
VPIELDGVTVRPGDIIYGDLDGVLVVPAEAAEQAFADAIEKVRGERKVLVALQNGMTSADAFRTFGIM